MPDVVTALWYVAVLIVSKLKSRICDQFIRFPVLSLQHYTLKGYRIGLVFR